MHCAKKGSTTSAPMRLAGLLLTVVLHGERGGGGDADGDHGAVAHAPRLHGRALRQAAAGGGREDKAHYAQSAKLQLKPLTEEGALAATTRRKRRWRRQATHAAHAAAATVLPPPTAPPRTLFKMSMGCIISFKDLYQVQWYV